MKYTYNKEINMIGIIEQYEKTKQYRDVRL